MKKKVVTLSLLTIIMCASLIVGATLALFTSKSDVNIAVTSGNVEVVATVDEITTYSMGEETATNGTFKAYANAFANESPTNSAPKRPAP